MAIKKPIYIASGWFTDEALADVNRIIDLLKKAEMVYFSPRDENLAQSDDHGVKLQQIFDGNINAIKNCSFVLANTRDKDMGTLFECGFAWSKGKRILYYCEGLSGEFNLMLARSGTAVATNMNELEYHLYNMYHSEEYRGIYRGKIE